MGECEAFPKCQIINQIMPKLMAPTDLSKHINFKALLEFI